MAFEVLPIRRLLGMASYHGWNMDYAFVLQRVELCLGLPCKYRPGTSGIAVRPGPLVTVYNYSYAGLGLVLAKK